MDNLVIEKECTWEEDVETDQWHFKKNRIEINTWKKSIEWNLKIWSANSIVQASTAKENIFTSVFQEKMQHKKIRKEKNYHGDSYIAKDLKIIIVTPT